MTSARAGRLCLANRSKRPVGASALCPNDLRDNPCDSATTLLFVTELLRLNVGSITRGVGFATQWAILLHQLGTMTGAQTAVTVAWVIVPLIMIAECFSWHAVLTRNYQHNAIENSIWAVTFFIVAVGLCRLLPEFDGAFRAAL